jgi:hypothetical protein
MRVALLISGMFRHFDFCRERLHKKIISPLGCDVFVDTWEFALAQKKVDKDGSKKISEFDIKNIQNIKGYRIEENIKLDNSDLKIEMARYENCIYMFYKIKSCFDLMKQYEQANGFKYDYVIRSRPDLYFEDIFYERYFVDSDNIFFSYSQYYHGVCDQFFWAKRDTMEKICYVYDKIREYHIDDKIKIYAEILLKHHIEKNQIKKEMNGHFRFGLVREPDHKHNSLWVHEHNG